MSAAACPCQHKYVKIPAGSGTGTKVKLCLFYSIGPASTNSQTISSCSTSVLVHTAAPQKPIKATVSGFTNIVTAYDLTQGLVSERDKAFRAQAFTLKQANTRVAQLQQQQAESSSREAALMEELSFGAIQGQPSAADSLLSAGEHGVTGLRKMQSRLPSGMETMRRRLEPIMSTGLPSILNICPLSS